MISLHFLGTSSTQPLPREGCRCPQCRSKDPKDKRTRSAALIDDKILIDAGPDILDELKKAKIKPSALEAIFITHEHSDATGGLKELLAKAPQARLFPPHPNKTYKIKNIKIRAFRVPHAKTKTIGFLINHQLIYISDTSRLHRALPYLKKASVAILDGSGWDRVFPTHETMTRQIKLIKPLPNLKKIYFTHNGHTHLPHRKMAKMVQKFGDKRFSIAYDGLKLRI